MYNFILGNYFFAFSSNRYKVSLSEIHDLRYLKVYLKKLPIVLIRCFMPKNDIFNLEIYFWFFVRKLNSVEFILEVRIQCS